MEWDGGSWAEGQDKTGSQALVPTNLLSRKELWVLVFLPPLACCSFHAPWTHTEDLVLISS
jgi:hypothetical protein